MSRWRHRVVRFNYLDEAIRYAESLDTDLVQIVDEAGEGRAELVWDKRPYRVYEGERFVRRLVIKSKSREEAIKIAESLTAHHVWVENFNLDRMTVWANPRRQRMIERARRERAWKEQAWSDYQDWRSRPRPRMPPPP